MSKNKILLAFATVALTSISAGSFISLHAQDKAAGAKAKWESLSPEERDKLKAEFKEKAKEKWESMTPEEREAAKAKFKEKAKEKWQNATPEQKEKMKEKMKERREARKNDGK